jgi:hypothetical protein
VNPRTTPCEYFESLSDRELEDLCRSICKDCGTDTTPPEGAREDYKVHDELWRAAGMPEEDGDVYLCVGCLEKRLGRELTAEDFTSCPVNNVSPEQSHRLRARLNTIKPTGRR